MKMKNIVVFSVFLFIMLTAGFADAAAPDAPDTKSTAQYLGNDTLNDVFVWS